MLRLALSALAPILVFAAAAPAAAQTPAAARGALPVGAFCTPARCRDGGGSAWTAAAFGAAVLVIHRGARRRSAR